MKTIIWLFPASLKLWECCPPPTLSPETLRMQLSGADACKNRHKNLFMSTWESHRMVIRNILWRCLLYIGSYWVNQLGIWHILGPRWMSPTWLYRSSDFASHAKSTFPLFHVFNSPKTSYRWASDAFLSASVNFCTAVMVVCQPD